MFAGSPEQCRQVVESAEAFKEALTERGVLLVVLPVYGGGAAVDADLPPLTQEDLRCPQTADLLKHRLSGIIFSNKMVAHFMAAARLWPSTCRRSRMKTLGEGVATGHQERLERGSREARVLFMSADHLVWQHIP